MTRKEKHIKLWDNIIIFLGDNPHKFKSFDILKEYVWRKTFNENIGPYLFCYACEESIEKNGRWDGSRCRHCPITKECGKCLHYNSVYDNIIKSFNNFVFDCGDIEEVIEYCKQIRDGWKE